jgi:hypothetical protein
VRTASKVHAYNIGDSFIAPNPDKLRSKFEVRVFREIQALKGREQYTVDYESEKIPYTISREYNPDFIIEFQDGHKLYIEAKGFLRWEDMEKLRAVKASNPDMDLRIVFEKDNRVRKNSKMRYSDWAVKHGFPFAVGQIPKEWLK